MDIELKERTVNQDATSDQLAKEKENQVLYF